MEKKIKEELKDLIKEEDKIISNTQPDTIKKIDEKVDKFIDDLEKKKEDDAI